MPRIATTTPLSFTYELQVVGFDGSYSFNPLLAKATINATVTAEVTGGVPPAVSIATPTEGEVFNYAASAMPATVPLSFYATTQSGAPFTTVEVRLGGNAIPNPPSVTYDENGILALGAAQLPILAAGSYSVVVRATNKHGTTADSHSFTVNVSGPPPTIVVNEPLPDSDFTSFGVTPVVVPNSFRADTTQGTLRTWSASLTDPAGGVQPTPISPSTPGGITSTGSVSLALNTSGRYTLTASVANTYGTASASTYFWINRVVNPLDRAVDAFQPAAFSVAATLRTDSTYTYRWERQSAANPGAGFQPLSNGGAYAGTTSLNLLVTRATGSMSGDKFRLVISRVGGGNITTANAVLTVNKLNPTIVWPAPAAIFYGTALSNAQLNASATFNNANVAGTFAYSPSGGVLAVGNQTLRVTFTPTDSENYNSASGSTILQVLKANQTISFGALAAKTVGDAPFVLGATASSGLQVSYASSHPAVATVSGSTVTIVGAGSTTITASQAGNAIYAAAISVSQTLTVTGGSTPPTCGTAIVRHAPVLNGNSGVAGSLQVLLPESIALNGNAWISKNLLVPGTPTLRVNGRPTYGSTIDGTGAASPTTHTVTLNGNNVLGHLVRRTNAVAMPFIDTPPAATGTRDVRLNKPSDSAGNFATVRDLTVSGTAASVAVPPGVYRDLTVTGTSSVVLGVANATVPAVYHVRSLKFTGNSQLKIVGPIVLTVADDAVFNDNVGNSAHPDWLKLNLFSGDLTLNGTVSLYGFVVAPAGEVKIDGQGKLRGGLTCDKLTMNGYGLVDLCSGSGQGSNSGGGCNDDDDDHHDHDDHHEGDDSRGKSGGRS